MTTWHDEADQLREKYKDDPLLIAFIEQLLSKVQVAENAILDIKTMVDGKPFYIDLPNRENLSRQHREIPPCSTVRHYDQEAIDSFLKPDSD